MRLASHLSLIAFVAACAASYPVIGQQPVLGYDDTPLQPDGTWRIHDSKRPRPPIVTPGAVRVGGPACGRDGAARQRQRSVALADGRRQAGAVADGKRRPANREGIHSNEAEFGDMQLHVEFATPSEVKGDSQGRGNSGVFLAGVFEIQVPR
jgi:hypothetical protein